MTTVCLTFDHLGSALDVGQGRRTLLDWTDPALLTGFPRILRLLEELDLAGTFFVEGWSLLHHPDQVLACGHEVAPHGVLSPNSRKLLATLGFRYDSSPLSADDGSGSGWSPGTRRW